jgi:hypothetical protein
VPIVPVPFAVVLRPLARLAIAIRYPTLVALPVAVRVIRVRLAGGLQRDWRRGIRGRRQAHIGRKGRRLWPLEQRGEAEDERHAAESSGGQLGHVHPPDPCVAAHLRHRTPDAGGLPPGRYSRPPVCPQRQTGNTSSS